MITIWKTGDIEYPDVEGIDKPVRYDMNSLIEIASRTGTINITQDHTKEVIGQMSNFIVKDGLLQADKPKDLELKGRGFSPVFDYDLVDMGDHYAPKNIKMTEVGYTKTPRSYIVYNSIENPNGDREMEDTQLRQALDDNRKLQEEIGVLKSQNSKFNAKLKEKDDEINSLKENHSENAKKLEEYDSLVEIKNKYEGIVASKKDDLIYELVGDDKEKAEKLKHFSIEDLELQIELAKGQTKPRGITPHDTHTDDGSDPTPSGEGDSDSVISDLAEAYEEMYGEKPVI